MTQVVGGMVMIAEVFANQGYDLYSFETKKPVKLIEIDNSQLMADIDRTNNVFKVE